MTNPPPSGQPQPPPWQQPGPAVPPGPGQPGQPTVGPPGWQQSWQPPSYVAARPSRAKLWVGLGALVLVLAAVVGVGFWLFGGDSPEDVVNAQLEAVQDGDCQEVLSYLSKDLRAREADCSGLTSEEVGALKVSSVEEVSATDDTATVRVKLTAGFLPIVLNYSLIKEDGDWVIDDIQAADGPF